jgi:hypothetical protein
MQELAASLRALAARDAAMEAPLRVEATLLRTLRGSKDTVNVNLPLGLPVRTQRFRLAIAAAAVLIVIAIAVSIIYTRPGRSAPTAGHEHVLPVPETPVPNREVQALNRDGGAAPRNEERSDREKQLARERGPARNKSTRRRGAGATGEERAESYEIATDYFPIDLGSYLQPFDGGRVVRVKLPRSALMNYGLPVDPLRADEAVKADVVIGNDGMARAIRFVH